MCFHRVYEDQRGLLGGPEGLVAVNEGIEQKMETTMFWKV